MKDVLQRQAVRDLPVAARRACFVLAAAIILPPVSPALAYVETPLASYEPAETDLTILPGAGDAGLTVTIVAGGVGGAPAATDGDHILKVDFVDETDGKVEFRHEWSASTYDLDGEEELLADVYISTPSAIPGLMGIWSTNWNPPDAWQQAGDIPTTTGAWTTISFNVSSRVQTGLDNIWAFIFEDMAGSTGTAYVDNLRFRRPGSAAGPDGVAAVANVDRVDVVWSPASTPGLQGYNIYSSDYPLGPFSKLNDTPQTETSYRDPVGAGSPRYYYYVTTVASGGESDPSETVDALYNGMTDDELLTTVQQRTFRYFWDYGHPTSGMAREAVGFTHSSDTVTTGGTGMGLITIMVGAKRGFVTRADAADRVLTILTFLDETASRYHGVWAHHLHGVTGETIPFAGYKDNGGDLVETAFLMEGMLTVRQYFDDPVDPVETEIRSRVTDMWEEVEWDWYRQWPGSYLLYWHWSPDYGFDLNHAIGGWNEAMIIYILAIASPTHPMPPESYYLGWASSGNYANGNSFYDYHLWVGPDYGGPMFWTHYSYLGFDPRYKRDAYCNYFENARHISLIHQAYSIDNPLDYKDYSALNWGLTASFDPFGYEAHSPTNDNGTISPTAAVSAMPYTPEKSLPTTRYFYDRYGASLWGPYGFLDAFNPEEAWFAPGYVAIDEGPIAPMIENYRTGLCWKMFMLNTEIKEALKDIGWSFSADFNGDGDIDVIDYAYFADCLAGPGETTVPDDCSTGEFAEADLDNDGDVDLSDYVIFQRLFDVP